MKKLVLLGALLFSPVTHADEYTYYCNYVKDYPAATAPQSEPQDTLKSSVAAQCTTCPPPAPPNPAPIHFSGFTLTTWYKPVPVGEGILRIRAVGNGYSVKSKMRTAFDQSSFVFNRDEMHEMFHYYSIGHGNLRIPREIFLGADKERHALGSDVDLYSSIDGITHIYSCVRPLH